MDTLSGLRRLLAVILLVGMSATTVELLLLRHVEDALQLVPVILLLAGIAGVIWHTSTRSPASATAVRLLMAMFVAAGLAGIYLHFAANVEFQKEIDPSLAGRALVWRALEATVPPALAPGVMLQLGLVGLAYTYRHKER
jgi:predicted membrane channel-forming protein YqfA (hemolysin III family)